MTETRLPASSCPHCGYKLDAATATQGDHVPTPGDLSVCLSCGGFLVFDDQLVPVEPAPRELAGLPPDILFKLIAARATILRMKETREDWPKPRRH